MKQPEALRLVNNRQSAHMLTWQANACAELRRLHEANATMLEALKGLHESFCRAGAPLTKEDRHEDCLRLIAARAAISKGEQQ